MAKKIKDLAGSFDFTGILSKKELIAGEKGKEGAKDKNDKFTLHIHDTELDSVVKLDIWGGSTGVYWSNLERKSVQVAGDALTIEKKMREVNSTRIGSPFSIILKGSTEKEYFIMDDVIKAINKVPEGKHKVNVTGSLGYKQYNGKTYREYKIKTIEVNTKKPLGLNVEFPVVIPDMSKEKFFFKDFPDNVPVLVKSKLEEGGYGYNPIELRLDKNWVLNGKAIEVAKSLNVELLTLVNDSLLKPMIANMRQIDSDYISAIVVGRLKAGEITKKPTVDNLNPMEKIMLTMQGEQAIAERLAGMELITEYFDSTYFGAFNIHDSKLYEGIEESELKLSNNGNKGVSTSNPMLDIMNGLSNKTEDNSGFSFDNDVEVKEETKEVVKNEELATTDDLDALIAQAEKEVNVEKSDDSDEFPF